MSSLTSALNTAKSALSATQTQSALVSRNIANVNTEGATRKYANVVTGSGGRVEVRSIAQSSDSVLYRNMLDSTSSLQQSTTVQDGLTRIEEMIGDIQNGQTPAALIGTFSDKLKAYATSPNSYEFARSASDAASDVVTALNQGTQTIDTIRRDADNELVNAATDMTKILADIEDINRQVVAGTLANRDVTDLVDQRDQAVVKLSEYVGVTAQTRGNNDLVLYTDSGVTIFDKLARTVTFNTTQPLVDGQPGNGFRIDGTLVTGANSMMPIKSGKIAGLMDLRDNVTVSYQSQLDEMARGLTASTLETSGGTTTLGIFTANGTLPTAAQVNGVAVIPGLARQIKVADAVTNDATKIRDGVGVVYNTTNAGGFTDRINTLVDNIAATRTFAPGTGAKTSGALTDYAASSTSWLEDKRSDAIAATEYKQTLLDRTKETLSNETGINYNDEILRLTELERSFQASSKVLSTVNEMLKTLMDAI